MIVVSDDRGDRVEVGETREKLEAFLLETCDEDYANQVLTWFDSGEAESGKRLILENGLEDILDTWEILDSE